MGAESCGDEYDGDAEDVGDGAVGVATQQGCAVDDDEQEDRDHREEDSVGRLGKQDGIDRLVADAGEDGADGENEQCDGACSGVFGPAFETQDSAGRVCGGDAAS